MTAKYDIRLTLDLALAITRLKVIEEGCDVLADLGDLKESRSLQDKLGRILGSVSSQGLAPPDPLQFCQEHAIGWLQEAQQQFPIHLLSNNPSRQRIGSVAQTLGLPFTTSAGKPRRGALRRVLAQLNLPAAQVALVGDRLFTDVIAGNRLGLFTVLVKPIDAKGQPCQRDRLQKMELRLAQWMGAALR